jgi:hypothetical protein
MAEMSTTLGGLLRGFQSVVIFACLLLAILHEMFFLIEPGAALRQLLAGRSGQLIAEKSTAEREKWFADAAEGGNVALHFQGFSATDPLFARYYFLGSYVLYPKRVIVGRGNKIINTQSQVRAADVLADDPWLRANDVRAVLTIRCNDDGVVDVQTRQLR